MVSPKIDRFGIGTAPWFWILMLLFVFVGIGAFAASDAEAAGKKPPKAKDVAHEAAEDKSRTAECAWIGQRVVVLMAREDVVFANHYIGFYDSFGCPRTRLTRAFECTVAGETANAAPQDLADRAQVCWQDPTAQPAAVPAKTNGKTRDDKPDAKAKDEPKAKDEARTAPVSEPRPPSP